MMHNLCTLPLANLTIVIRPVGVAHQQCADFDLIIKLLDVHCAVSASYEL